MCPRAALILGNGRANPHIANAPLEHALAQCLLDMRVVWGNSWWILLFGNLGKQFWEHAAAHLQGNMFRILPRQNLTIWRPHIAGKYFQSFVVTELYNLVNFHAAHLQESQIRILQRQDFTI